jgi:uncharacterized membrane protein
MIQALSAPPRARQAGREMAPGDARRINVADAERWVSLLGGGALTFFGLTRGSWPGLALAAVGGALVYRGYTGHCHLYGALGVRSAEPHSHQASIPAGHGFKVEESITILRPADELYRFWRNFENLPNVMPYLRSVECTDNNHSHWVAEGPLGGVAWDAEVITERPNELIGWRSLQGSTVDTAGSVHFTRAPGDRGTEVKVTLKYDPPAGSAGATFAWMMGKDPQAEVREALRSFKRVMETGGVPTTEGQPQGRCG